MAAPASGKFWLPSGRRQKRVGHHYSCRCAKTGDVPVVGATSQSHLSRTAVQKPKFSEMTVEKSSDQAGHVGEVTVPQRGDEVVHQPQLGRLAVDVGRDEEEARLGAKHRIGRQQVLAGAALRTQHGGGGAGGEGGQEDEEEEREDKHGNDVHGCSPAATHKDKQSWSI